LINPNEVLVNPGFVYFCQILPSQVQGAAGLEQLQFPDEPFDAILRSHDSQAAQQALQFNRFRLSLRVTGRACARCGYFVDFADSIVADVVACLGLDRLQELEHRGHYNFLIDRFLLSLIAFKSPGLIYIIIIIIVILSIL